MHQPTATAVIADVHLGYDHVRRCGGEAVPLVDVAEILGAFAYLCAARRALARHRRGFLRGRPPPGPVAELLAAFTAARIELLGVVPGDHDRKLVIDVPLLANGLTLGRWKVIHGDAPARGRVVQGHYHPCVRWSGIAAPCYLFGPRRLVLPAFSADAAGVDVLPAALQRRDYRFAVIVGGKVLDFGPVVGLKKLTTEGHERTAKKKKTKSSKARRSGVSPPGTRSALLAVLPSVFFVSFVPLWSRVSRHSHQ